MKIFIFISVLFSFTESNDKFNCENLFGKHWAGGCVSNHCDTLRFLAFKKYDSRRYQWASGYSEGVEFYRDGKAQTYSNVLCSSESDPVDSYTSTWKLKNDTLLLDEYNIIITYKIILLSKKEMKLLELGYKVKAEK
jgi:hypothetical protein